MKGFSGLWTFYRPDSAEDEAVNSSFRCLRTYETLGTDPITIKFRTFNQLEPGNGSAKARPLDGVFESDHSRLATDPFFTVSSPHYQVASCHTAVAASPKLCSGMGHSKAVLLMKGEEGGE